MTRLQIQTTIRDWRTQWYSDTCCDLVQAVLVSDNRQLPLPRPPVIHDGCYWWSCIAAAPPLNLATLGNRNLLQLHTVELTELPSPPRSWPAARRLMSLRHGERRAPIDTMDRTPLYIKQSGKLSVLFTAIPRLNYSVL